MKYLNKYFPKLKATERETAIAITCRAIMNTYVPDRLPPRLVGAMRLIDNCQDRKGLRTIARYCDTLTEELEEFREHDHKFQYQFPSGWKNVFKFKLTGKLLELQDATNATK